MKFIFAAFLLLGGPAPLTLDITPRAAYDWNGVKAAVFRYRVRIAEPKGKILCTGWVYPVVQFHRDEWPYRRSCFAPEFHTYDILWRAEELANGLPGDYTGFAQLYGPDSQRPIINIEQPFRMLEGLPR